MDFPIFADLQPVIPLPEDEIQVVDLLGFLNPDDQHFHNPINQDMFIGFSQLLQPEVDPVLTALVPANDAQPNPDAIRLWVKYFSHKDPSLPSVLIPDSWMSFFVFMLL